MSGCECDWALASGVRLPRKGSAWWGRHQEDLGRTELGAAPVLGWRRLIGDTEWAGGGGERSGSSLGLQGKLCQAEMGEITGVKAARVRTET